jgi:glycerol-3-phosphate acyltransferase PlsY
MWIILPLLVIACLVFAFGPWFKSYRTVAYGWLTAAWAAILPIAGDITGYLKDLDWRQYVAPEQAPWVILAVTILFITLRHRTNSAVGQK